MHSRLSLESLLHGSVPAYCAGSFVLAAAYAVLGALGLALAMPPSDASPVFPAAGLALAMVLRYGARALPGIWLGSMLLHLPASWAADTVLATTLLISSIIAGGASLQAWVGQRLVQHSLPGKWSRLESERDVLIFLALGGLVAGLISASCGIGTLLASGIVGKAQFSTAWWTWYVGDTLGVLLFAPLCIGLQFRHASCWQGRLGKTAGVMLVALLLAAGVFFVAARAEQDIEQHELQDHGDELASALQSRFAAHRETLVALARFIEVNPALSPEQFEHLTAGTLHEHSDLAAVSYNAFVAAAQRHSFERRMAELSPAGQYQITELGAAGQLVRAADRADYVAVRNIVPLDGNAPALGYDLLSEPRRRDAVERARRSGRVAITSGLQLVQDLQDQQHHASLLLLAPAYDLAGSGHDSTTGPAPLGFAVMVIKTDQLIAAAVDGHLSAELAIRLDELTPSGERRNLFHSAGAAALPVGNQVWQTRLSMADRTWELRVAPTEAFLQTQRPWLAWGVGVSGLFIATLLQILILGTTSRAAMVQRRVEEQTLEIRSSHQALQASEERYRSVVESIKEVIFQTDTQGRWTYLNRAWEEITGFAVADTLGQAFLDHVHPDDRARHQALFDQLVESRNEGAPYSRHEVRYLHKDGSFRWVEVLARLTSGPDGVIVGTSGTLSDVTARHSTDEQLRLAASVFTHTHEGIILTDADNRIVDVNEAFTRITGYARREVLGRDPSLLKAASHADDLYASMWSELQQIGFWQGEMWNQRKNGEVYPELLTISVVRDIQGKVQHHVAVFADISHIKHHQQELERTAHYDALTHLPNRLLLADRLRQALIQAARSNSVVAVCYLDLDGFKAINDELGHAAGDQVLIEMAGRLQGALRAGDTVARLGGDEFVLLLINLKTTEECKTGLQRVIRAVAEPISVSGRTASVSASIGVAFYPETGADADTLLRQADMAMYVAKQTGKNRYQLFDPEHDRRARQHRSRLQELDQALTRNEFLLYYQPKVNMRTGSVIGFEALLRWQHPEQGLLAPGEFLFDLDQAELEYRIGQWVLGRTVTQLEAWSGQDCCLPVSVNISAPHLEHPDFIGQLTGLLETHPGVRGKLDLEVLETAALADVERVAQLIRACQALRIGFALDDFGTGYSSLTYLRRLPAETLKIDKSFVQDMLNDPDDLVIVEGVIGLTRAFGRKVIAEGVETVEHGVALLRLGCDLAQGYGIARPMPAADVPGWLAGWRADPAWRAACGAESEPADW